MFYSFFPTGGRFYLIVAFSVFFLSIVSGYAADVRCELVADSCLDLSRVTNQTITVPSNTTRIDKNGFDLCLPSNSIDTEVDLVFVVDQSTSMEGSDPNFLTPPATIAALNLIDKISPGSNVGYMGFAGGICDGTQKTSKVGKGQRLIDQVDTRVLPKPLNTPGHKDILLNQMAYDKTSYLYGCGSNANRGTNYYLALLQAEKWLDQMDTPNKKIIIFLTDGRPSNNIEEYTNLVNSEDSTTFPLVHAMFVGSRSNADLERLTLKTGGIFTQMDDFTKLERVMLDMIGTSINSTAPDKTIIKKNGVIAFETANHTAKGGARHQVNLSHDLALELGAHNFNVSSTTSWAGVVADNFNLIVGGPAETTTGLKGLPGTDLFSAVCYDVSSISATETGNANTITQLGAFYETGFGISLKTPADDIDGVARVLGSGDDESVTLDSSASGYHGPAVFAGTVLKTPKNGTVEAIVGETLLLSWVHPYDPRDTASALLAIVDDRADSTSILFTDMQGNIITSTIGLAGNQFKVVVFDNKATGPFSVQLTSSHGDTLTVTIINTGPQTFESAVAFGFSNAVNPANSIIEGVLDPTSTLNQTTVTAKVKKAAKTLLLQKKIIPVEKSWIVDQNGDGRADKVFIRYSGKLPGPPATVTDIHWPDSISIAKNASAIENPISFFNGDSSLVQIDLSGNPFDFGATSASSQSPPTLLLPDGVKVTIQDSVKPILIAVDKRPSDFSLYMRARDSVFVTRPDTLIITLSEAIKPGPNAVAPWNTLLLVERNGVLQPVEFIKEPEVISPDGRIIKALIRNQLDSNNLNAGNTVTLNPGAQYVDEKNNTPGARKIQITGRDGKKNDFISAWRGGPVSGDQKQQTSFSESLEVVVIDESINMIVGLVTTTNVEQWVPPVGVDPASGNVIDINFQMGGLCTDNQNQRTDFPDECLSSRLILTGPTDGPYIAHIRIYDHLGKFIRRFKQAFGYCGELDNPVRTTESGFKMNDLFWNLTDQNGDVVGNGVYIWRVKLRFKNGKSKSKQFRMGVFRKNDGLYNACIQGLKTGGGI